VLGSRNKNYVSLSISVEIGEEAEWGDSIGKSIIQGHSYRIFVFYIQSKRNKYKEHR